MSRPWASQHLGLPIERQMPGVFGDQHRGDHRLGRQPALDQPFGRRRLNHRLLAGAAGIFGTVRHDHPELRRDHVEPLRGVLADHMHRRAAARAVGVFGLDRHMNARQMGGQRAAIGAALLGARRCGRRVLLVVGGFARRQSLARYPRAPEASWSGSSFSERRPNCMRCSWRSRCARRSILRRAPGRARQSRRPAPRAPPPASACSAVDIGRKLICDLAHAQH